MKNLIKKGKKAKGNLKAQGKINKLVLIGFASTLYCMLALFPNTFIDLKIVLGLYFIPSIPLAYKLNKTIIKICGYEQHNSNTPSYNIVINLLSYVLIAVFVGGLTVTLFLKINMVFTENKSETHYIKPQDITLRKRSHKDYYYYQLKFNDISKQINGNGPSIDRIKNSTVILKVNKGFFGYYILESRTLIENDQS